MKSHCTRNALLCLLLGATSALQAQESTQAPPQVIEIPLARPGEPISLDISILSADIEVIGEEREDAHFEVSVTDGARKIITPSGTKDLNIGAYGVDVEQRDNRITLDTDWRANRVRVLARVPRQADLELSTVNNGTIKVDNIAGSLTLQNVNGPITATGITGSVIAESVNDDIRISFDRLEGGAMSMISVNGDLILGLPSDAGADLHIDSSEGEIISDFDVDVVPSEPVVTRNATHGGVEVKVENVIVAKVSGGGPVFKLKTLNGDIRIQKSN